MLGGFQVGVTFPGSCWKDPSEKDRVDCRQRVCTRQCALRGVCMCVCAWAKGTDGGTCLHTSPEGSDSLLLVALSPACTDFTRAALKVHRSDQINESLPEKSGHNTVKLPGGCNVQPGPCLDPPPPALSFASGRLGRSTWSYLLDQAGELQVC